MVQRMDESEPMDTTAGYSPPSTSDTGSASGQGVKQPLHEVKVGGVPHAYESETPRKLGMLNVIEQRLALYSLDKNLSNAEYTELADFIQFAMDHARDSSERVSITSTIPSTHVILALMLSSDQTAVSVNGRFKLWPVNLKLANIPKEIRNIPEHYASRVIAYLPSIDNPADGRSRPWWSLLLRGTGNLIYHCIPALAAYSADLPEHAANIPDFTGLRKFTSGFLLSALKNPTYGELREHMKSYLRKIFAELQHKRDAKKPSERANYHKAGFVTQVSKFINRRDLLHDEYPIPIRYIAAMGDQQSQSMESSKYELLYPLYNGTLAKFHQFAQCNGVEFSDLYELVCYFLHTATDGNTSRVNSTADLPEPDYQLLTQARFYQALALNECIDENEMNREILRSSSDFRGDERRHYVFFKGGYYGQVLSFFSIAYDGLQYDLCYCQRYDPAFDEHATGLEVVYTTENWDYEGRFVAPVSEIVRSAHIVPDFACPTYSVISKYPYDQYLVNYDASQYHWFEGRDRGILKTVDKEKLVTWNEECADATIDESEESELSP
ncbi:hypothetical protein BJV82DRAFT_581762 [Fennellomyces sp. T-0311]|nr:hypothetical protein BJV82DRAFT_581762 [Fennellomyces sp. T-0311]